MTTEHARALQTFELRLHWLLVFRLGIRMAAAWLFFWGVVVLAWRVCGGQDIFRLSLGILGVIPLGVLAVWLAQRQRPTHAKIRADYDRLNQCGGVIMSEEAVDMHPWLARLPGATVPRLRWRGGSALLLLGIAILFVTTALMLPERLTNPFSKRPLEIGTLVEQLQAEVTVLAQEKIVADPQAEELQKQLAQLQSDSSGYDPNKTWEALDHIQQANRDAAKEAAEEALAQAEALTQAETLAQAMEQALGVQMDEMTATQAAQDLASRLKAAKLEEGVLNAKIPPELLSHLDGLDKEQLQKLLQAMASSKTSINAALVRLANLRLIDAATLAKCKNAGQCRNPGPLAEYLSQCTNGCNSALIAECLLPGNGGPGGGGPAAPMTWTDGASEAGLNFQEHALPPASRLTDAQLINISKAAPEVNTGEAAAGPGALDHAAAGGGSAHAQALLPEQRRVVQNFFKREK